MKLVRAEKGTALLVALLVMGILTAVSLAISSLIIREIGITRLALDAGRAYYAAESGVELALLQLEENLAGYEPAGGEIGVEFEDSEVVFGISNKATEYPYIDPEQYELGGVSPEVYYDVLELNESITVPLFTVGEGGLNNVTKFVVQYYVDFDFNDLKIKQSGGFPVEGWDILRWKIYGMGEGAVTESINDFTAVTVTDSGAVTNAAAPTWFGSVSCETDDEKGIVCYQYGELDPILIENEDGQMIYAGSCLPTQAREHYFYSGGKVEEVKHCYDIGTFLENHEYNYLTLTNLMNPAVFSIDFNKATREKKSRLYFRVVVLGDSGASIVREFAEINSTGESGESKVKLNVLKKRDSYLPVFNFALYQTR